jgi:excisionase family DNA binding protein
MDDRDKAFPTPVAGNEIQVAPAYLSYEELSSRTGLSISTLRRRVSDGTLPCFQPGGSRTRVVFPVDIVERCLQAGAAAIPAQSVMPESPPMPRRGPRPRWQAQH